VGVLVKLHYVLRTYVPMRDFKKPFTLTAADGGVLGEVITAPGLPNDRGYLLLAGSECAARDRLLIDGDTVTILPPVIGG
jgi:hypothetical protein